MGNPWYRAWVGLVSDQKIAEAALVADCQRAVVVAVWHALLESASEVDDFGAFVATPRRIAATLCEPASRIEAVFAALTEIGMIAEGVIVAWERRQPVSESNADAAERQRQSRARRALLKAQAELDFSRHSLSQPVTPPELERDPDPSLPPDAGARAKPGNPFGELTGARFVPLGGGDLVEAEARAAMAGLAIAGDGDFAAVRAALAEPGVLHADLAVALADARAKGESCPRTWRGFAPFVATAARQRAAREARAATGPPRTGAAASLAVCLELAGGDDPPAPRAPPPDDAVAAMLARCRARLDEGEIAAEQAPDAAGRAALEARRAALDRALAAAGAEAARREVARLFARNHVGLPPPGETRALIASYAEAIKGQPLWAISAACAACIAGGEKFRPSAGDLVARVSRLAAAPRAEQALIGRVLAAKIARRSTPEERARAVAAYRAGTGAAAMDRGAA